jgi:hypothetical protein
LLVEINIPSGFKEQNDKGEQEILSKEHDEDEGYKNYTG